MLKKLLPAALIGYVFLIIVNWSCTKLDTTKLGSDLIPAVDNVYTFSDTFDIETSQGIFNDSFKIDRSVNNVLGVINGDELIGSTTANMFFQIKPGFFPFYYGNVGDTILPTLDSAFLCLSYVGFWGDSMTTQQLQVYSIDDRTFSDSAYHYHKIDYEPANLGPMIGSATVDIRKLKDTIKTRNDSMVNQIRIRLDQSFAQNFFNGDTIPYKSDSLYRSKFHGFAVKATNGNALMYISLTDTKTRMELHYRRKLKANGNLDTTSTYLYVNNNTFGSIFPSSSSNYIHKNYSSAVTSPSPNNIFLVAGPGTYANLRIPALDTLSNRIVHRAEIYFEQDPDFAGGLDDSIFSPPTYMYLDLKDTGTNKWKPLYHDLNPNIDYDPDYKIAGLSYYPGSVEFAYFGGFPRYRTNEIGQKVVYYTLNITRHVQRKVIKGNSSPNYNFRLFPAYNFSYPQIPNSSAIGYNNPLGHGRIRIKSGAYPDRKLRMRMVVIWSKI